MFDSAEIRSIRPARRIARFGTKSQGQGHETTYAQIIAEELGIPGGHIQVEEGDTDTAPYGLGTYASRSTPTAGAAGRDGGAQDPRQGEEDRRAPARGRRGRPGVGHRSLPGQGRARAASRRSRRSPSPRTPIIRRAWRPGLEAIDYYDPPNLTFPFGSYICVVDIDRGTGEVKIRRFVAVDDCGNIINPMIVEGQIHGGLTMGLAPALFEEIVYDENGNNLPARSWTTCCPRRVETRVGDRQDGHAVARIIRSAPRASASRRRSARRPRSPTRWSTRSAHLGVRQHRHPDHAARRSGSCCATKV